MRPVDADALKAKAFGKRGGLIHTSDIDAAPTVDAAPVVHGRWIDIDSETYTWKIRCNKCGHERSMMSTGQIYPMCCENCGARMDGKGDSNG